MDPETIDRWRERVAHALTPWEWSQRSLVAGIASLLLIMGIVVAQRLLLAEGRVATIVSIVLGVVWMGFAVALAARAAREWRRRNPS